MKLWVQGFARGKGDEKFGTDVLAGSLCFAVLALGEVEHQEFALERDLLPHSNHDTIALLVRFYLDFVHE